MNMIRKLLLAFVLSCGLAPAFAQAPPPVPALPDTERRTSYTASATTGPFSVNFALFGDSTDYQNWLEVYVNGVLLPQAGGWTLTSPSGPIANLPRPITDAQITFSIAQTGTVQIVGARRPRRISQFSENTGVSARNLNQTFTDIIAQNREIWDKTNDFTGRGMFAPPGESMPVLPPAASRANMGVCFDSAGNVSTCATIPSSTFTAGAGIAFTGSNPTSISVTLTNAICTVAPSVCTSFFGYANPIWWGADPTGVANSAAAINSASAASNLVSMSAGGTYRITTSVVMQPNQRLNCNGSTITQGNGDNVAIMINAFSTTPTGSRIDHCVLDQNSANNTFGSNYIVDVSGPDNVTVEYNTIKNCTGGGIAIANSISSIVEHNYIYNCPNFGVALIHTTPGTSTYAGIRFNKIVGPSQHLLQVTQAHYNDLSNNVLLAGTLIGDAVNPMHVTVAGTAVSWVSGPTFAGTALGSFLVVNGGTECLISSINSSISITLATSCGSLTNVFGAIGGGDVLSLTNTSYNRITNNIVSGGVTGGIVMANGGGSFASTDNSNNNIISGNIVTGNGNFGIALEAPAAAGSPTVNATVITGNQIISPGRSGSAGIAGAGIQLSSAAGLMVGVHVANNYLYDYSSVAGGFWLTGSGAANATFVTFGPNTVQSFANGSVMSGYPTYASLAPIRGATAHIIDGLAGNCGDGACTAFGTGVGGGGGSLKLSIWNNGSQWTLTGK